MKVKQVNFNFELEGNGIVNFDSGVQKFLWNRESKEGKKNNFSSVDNNNVYAKKVYHRDENGVLRYKIKISSDALRNAIFKGDAIATNSSISHHKALLNSFIGSTLGLVRGYMFAGRSETLKKKSPLTITAAHQTNNAESYMEFHSRSGYKKVADDSGTGDTTIFNKETIGEITYEGKGFINLQDLEFISCDPIFDRYSFNPDDYETLKMFLSNNLPGFNSELGYHTLKSSAIDVAEYGIKLNNDNILFLIKETLRRVFSMNIMKANSYAKISKLSIQLVVDPINPSKNLWIDINSVEDINNLNFEIEEFYTLTDESDAKAKREIIEEAIRKDIEIKIQEKEKKQKEKKA